MTQSNLKFSLRINFLFNVLTLVALFLLLINCSCRGSKPLQCKNIDIAQARSSTDFCNFYDQESKTRYGFGKNDTTFYLKIEFLDDQIARQVAMNGMNVYFDKKDRKNHDCYLNFPMKKERVKMSSPSAPPSLKSTKKGERPREDITEKVSEIASWSFFDSMYMFNWRVEGSPFEVKLSTGLINQLVYEALIPISKLSLTEGDSTFTVGIEIEKGISISKQNNSNGEMSMGGQGGPGGPPPGGGMMQGGPPQGGMGMGSAQGMNESSSSTPIKIWFFVGF